VTDGGTQTNPAARDDPENGNAAVDSSTTEPPPPTLDIAQVQSDIDRIMDEILAGNSGSTVRQQAETIYNDDAVPDSLRASAAFAVASAFADELQNTDACTWALRAQRAFPSTDYAGLISLIDQQLRSNNTNSPGCTL